MAMTCVPVQLLLLSVHGLLGNAAWHQLS